MSSKIQLQRVCQHCGKDFTARTTSTRYCSHKCNGAAYKAKQMDYKVEESNKETQRIKTQPIEVLKAKEFLKVRDVATLLNCSVRSVYYQIENGNIKALNLGQKLTRVKRSDLDNLFVQPQNIQPPPSPIEYNISDCYTINQTINKYGISDKGLYNLIKRHSIPKIKKGRYAYIPKSLIDKLLS